MNNTPQNTRVKIDDELRQKWERYERIRHEDLNWKMKIAKKIETFSSLYALACLGVAMASPASSSVRPIATTSALVIGGGAIAMETARKKYFKNQISNLKQQRKYWFGTEKEI